MIEPEKAVEETFLYAIAMAATNEASVSDYDCAREALLRFYPEIDDALCERLARCIAVLREHPMWPELVARRREITRLSRLIGDLPGH